ncbi:hypothetical protein GOP47_0000714 [Adiantum capillus-veneris]|uniref:Uncharacterized protein n=1 Tax=Adiantum capillus-veneris TaxID=13818 RepID=A0A9D4VEG7_ADICA|nr:hypothetical protein GOP47_0000714 [Adiantum capillus-veneris]
MEELIAPPRALDVQQFAKARATELLSLHSALRTRKRKASQQPDGNSSLGNADCTSTLGNTGGTSTHTDGDGDGNGQLNDSGLSNTFAPLPRHLRRRTSSYVRRHRPLPWLYKRKKNPCITHSSLYVRPKKRRKQRQKKSRLLQQNPSLDSRKGPSHEFGSSWNGHQFAGLASRLDSDGIAIDSSFTQRLPRDFDAAMSPLTPAIFQQDLQDALDVQQQSDRAWDGSLSFQGSGTGGISSVNISAPNIFFHLGSSGEAVLENIEVAGALTHVGCIVSEDKSADFASSQAAQQEVVPMSEDDIAPSVQEGSHEVQQDSVVNGESSVCLMVDDVTGFACHTVQEDSTEHISTEEDHAPTCIDGVLSEIQMGTFQVQDIKTKKKKMCRSLRRLLEFKPGGSFISSDGTWRLGTHVWHAKRFTMEKIWGYRIPLGRHGRGHGSRAVLRWSKSKALLHDCSFMNAIQLIGSVEKICEVLRPVLELPQGMDSYLSGAGSFSGEYFTTAILGHVGHASPGIICPAIMMWKPTMPEISSSTCTAEKVESLQERNLWLWVHAAAFEEAYQVLKDICFQVNKHMKEERVECVSRKGDLGRLDLIGEGAFAVLQKVLFPICRDSQGKCIKLEQLTDVLNSKQINGKAVVHLEVSDPRLKENERSLALDPVCISPVAVFNDRGSKAENFRVEGNKIAETDVEYEQENLNTYTGEGTHYKKKVDALWACGPNSAKPEFEQPMREKFFSRMRHANRLDSFGLTEIAKNNNALERRKNLSRRFACPVILLKHEHEEASACCWSLILPINWISAFWVPLVFAGGHVIGTRERHWLYTNAGSPTFPDDFPDCKAYADTKADKSLQAAQVLCKRLNEMGPRMPEQIHACVQEDAVQVPLVHSPSMSCPRDEDKTQCVAGPEYSCFVARTAEQLVSYLQMTQQTGLLLFPARTHTATKFRGLGSRLHEGTVVWRPKLQNLPTIQCSQAVCVLRVCLRPFCRGVVKLGAKVYVPTSEDYLVWCCKRNASETSVSGERSSEKALGYVTSMAPRGSKVSAAIAFCDAAELASARQRQWVDTTWNRKGGIFLMFCNERSTTFRPGLASICIEGGPDI